ncbi:MAG: DUF5686 and carboxypeptidase regulatory-like domain-containing protein [Dysgonamonadaceae bacterium]|nr:DUF5686 and carboxypeptidase regulatory-like domain-containing protein [Dysgonamonadaceae bacterium]
MIKKSALSLLVLCYCLATSAQTTTVKGIVIDSISQIPLPYVAVFFGNTTTGTLSDNAGRFSISIPQDNSPTREIIVALSDYKLLKIRVAGGKTSALTVQLQPFDRQGSISPPDERWEGNPVYDLLYKAAKITADDYIPIGNPQTNLFDFGRVQTAASYNYIEGLRLRGGLASTSRLHQHLFLSGYAAYGFLDRKPKYHGEAIWAFNKPKYHEGEFPANNLRLIHEYDIYSLGEIHPHSQNDKLLYSFRRARGSLAYRRFSEINYEKESYSGFSYLVWANLRKLTPAGRLSFADNETGDISNNLNITETGFRLRYSPEEAFRQNRRKKKLLSVESPIFEFAYSLGLKNVLGGEYSYHRTEFSVQKRFPLGDFGYIDTSAEMQHIWTKVPFPLLLFPNANSSYLIENDSFSMLTAMEFINDSQYTVKATYEADKLLLTRIPYLEDLMLHEVFSIRGVYGQLSDKNNPALSGGLFEFPHSSRLMSHEPYWEGGIGVANIGGVLRIDYVFRLSYRNEKGAAKNGFRVGVSL